MTPTQHATSANRITRRVVMFFSICRNPGDSLAVTCRHHRPAKIVSQASEMTCRGSSRRIPSPAGGGGGGGGGALAASQCRRMGPLPNPPPQAGEGSAKAPPSSAPQRSFHNRDRFADYAVDVER